MKTGAADGGSAMETGGDVMVVGAGWIARQGYLPAFARLGWRATCFDTGDDPAGRAALVRAIDLARQSGPATLCIVATPNASHLALAGAFLANGCRVLVEKPACLPWEVETAVAAALPLERLFVSTPFRFRPDVVRLIDAVAEGAVGEIRSVEATWRRRSGIPRPGSWYTARRLSGGGVLADLGPHLLDTAMTLLGWPEMTVLAARLTAAADALAPGGASTWMAAGAADDLPLDVEIAADVSWRDARGRDLRLRASWHDDIPADATVIEVAGTRGRLRLDTLFGFAPGPSLGRLSSAVDASIPLQRQPSADFARMLRLVQQGRAATGTQGIAVMRLIAGAYDRGGVVSPGTAATDVPR